MVRQRGSRLQVKRGRYGSSKCKAFTALKQYQWLPARQLCVICGIGYPSLGRTLCRWVRFEYVVRRPILYGGDFEYAITAKGKKWLSLAAMYLPNYSIFQDELQRWYNNLADEKIAELMSMPFTEFIIELNSLIKRFQGNNKNSGKST